MRLGFGGCSAQRDVVSVVIDKILQELDERGESVSMMLQARCAAALTAYHAAPPRASPSLPRVPLRSVRCAPARAVMGASTYTT